MKIVENTRFLRCTMIHRILRESGTWAAVIKMAYFIKRARTQTFRKGGPWFFNKRRTLYQNSLYELKYDNSLYLKTQV